MRLRTSFLLGLAAIAGSCDAPAPVDVSAWPGTYDATFEGTITVLEPAGFPRRHASSAATMTVKTTETSGELLFAWRRDDEPTNGTLAFRVDGDDATLVEGSPLNEPFTGEVTSGVLATIVCTTCTAHLDDGTIRQTQSGKAGGTIDGIPWTGTYSGTWVGTRRGSHDGGTGH